MNLIQASSQSIAEMREKLKILDNEIDILRAESADMDHQLQKQRHDYQVEQTKRDQLQNEKNRKLHEFQLRQDLVDQQIAEMDKLNSIINRAERGACRRWGRGKVFGGTKRWCGVDDRAYHSRPRRHAAAQEELRDGD